MVFELAQEVDRLVEVHREGGAALGEAFHRDIGGADLADGLLEADQLGEVTERADLELELALEESVRGWRALPFRWCGRDDRLRSGGRVGRDDSPASASFTSRTRLPTSTASRSAFIRIRVAWPRAWACRSSNRAETASSEAMLRSWTRSPPRGAR